MKTSDISDKAVCIATAAAWKNSLREGSPWEILLKMSGYPEKIVWAAMNRANDRDLVEYGVSIRCCWLTAKGEELLSKVD